MCRDGLRSGPGNLCCQAGFGAASQPIAAQDRSYSEMSISARFVEDGKPIDLSNNLFIPQFFSRITIDHKRQQITNLQAEYKSFQITV